MPDKSTENSPYFQMPSGTWDDIDEATRTEVVRLQGTLGTIIGELGDSDRLTPIEVAARLNEVASRLFEQLVGDERDIRQVITTLRTAHAVAWDMNDAVQARTTTVEQYMSQLRDTIDSFESDLQALRVERAAPN